MLKTTDDTEGEFQVKVSLATVESHDQVPARDRFECDLVGFVTDVPAPAREVRCLGTEVGLVPEPEDKVQRPIVVVGTRER